MVGGGAKRGAPDGDGPSCVRHRVEAANQLAALGIAIDTTGAASVVGSATPDVLRRASEQPWVLAVEEPRRLFPR